MDVWIHLELEVLSQFYLPPLTTDKQDRVKSRWTPQFRSIWSLLSSWDWAPCPHYHPSRPSSWVENIYALFQRGGRGMVDSYIRMGILHWKGIKDEYSYRRRYRKKNRLRSFAMSQTKTFLLPDLVEMCPWTWAVNPHHDAVGESSATCYLHTRLLLITWTSDYARPWIRGLDR